MARMESMRAGAQLLTLAEDATFTEQKRTEAVRSLMVDFFAAEKNALEDKVGCPCF